VVLITIDTLRADRLQYHGYDRPTSPFLDTLAAESTVFEHAMATSPSTAPSIASLLTGMHRASHGVHANGATLPDAVETVSELLRANGYRTAARIANPMLEANRGFAQGFDDFSMPSTLSRQAPNFFDGAPLVEEVVGLIDELAGSLFFLWVHLYDPHGPYHPPQAYRDSFRAEDYRWEGEADLPLSSGLNGLSLLPVYQAVGALRAPSAYRANYDAEIRYTDDHVQAIVARLRARGIWDRIVFVLTADHGESLGEHGYYFQHGWFAYEDCVRVPLLVRAPRLLPSGSRVRSPVSVIDVAPTLLALLGLPPRPDMEGTSLVGAARGEVAERPVFAQSYHGTGSAAVRLGRRKYIFTPARSPAAPPPSALDGVILPAAPRHELYDVVADPGEIRDLAATDVEGLRDLQQRLRAWLAAQQERVKVRASAPIKRDPLLEAQLHALGYVN
jgi:arylsulfatase